ncbi:retinol dehydrogenase 16-like [Eublepharis macularius]|uniref:Retinol dehydrogenase 16-like n=1 Tax=Eublepharis macularius TaxID=481883 RepID=A0AA97J988_EUBMA|nr:retinol dehydrogenase 16-like [Eublepharis macularius]XP_054833172.1 retinol dehydrogenase 16-like [Eublepharis macularius]
MWLYLAVLGAFSFLYQWYWKRQTVENLTEKFVFITGCDSGFGNHLAKQLDGKGMRVLAACHRKEGAELLKKTTSDRLKTTVLELTSTESVAAAAEWVKQCVGDKGLWGLVNNAGTTKPSGPNEWLTKDDFAKLINVNLLGLIDVTLQLLPLLKRARGRVVNVSSLGGRVALFGGGYSPSKYGLEAFSNTLRQELHHFGVRVSIIEPGFFITNAHRNSEETLRDIWKHLPSHLKESYGQQYLEDYCNRYNFVFKHASEDLRVVSDSMEHALTSTYPHTRYMPGFISPLILLFNSLPDTITDRLVIWCYPKPAQAI